MIRHPINLNWLVCLFLLGIVLQPQAAYAADSKLVILGAGNESQQDTAVDKENPKSDRIAGKPIETLVLTLSDEQVQHLIEALTKSPPQAAAVKPEEKDGALVGLIKKIRNLSNTIQMRIQVLKSGARADPEDQPHLYRLLSKGENQEKSDPLKTIMSVIGLLSVSLAIQWIFRRMIATFQRRIERATSEDWKAKIGGLALRSFAEISIE